MPRQVTQEWEDQLYRMKKLAPIFLALIIFFVSPFSSAAENSDPDLKKERQIGEKAVAEIEKQWPLTSDPAIISKLEVILHRLEPYMERRIKWEVRLVKAEALNAFCLPGGFIFFTTGMIEALDTDSELAAVMAHEMIHADRKHGLRMAADANKINLATLAVMLLSGGSAAPIILAQVANVAITSAYTLELEKEADKLGLEALIKSGYSPTGMITLFERFMAEEYRQPIIEYGIYMNHPGTKDRLNSAVKILHDRKIPIERKYPLGLLRTDIQESSNEIKITVDGQAVLTGKKTAPNRLAFKKIRQALDKNLQLELAPYELHVMNDAFYIGNNLILSKTLDVTDPKEFRTNLLKSINSARAKHPTSKFFK